jgi:hypothetical protein
LAQDRLEVCPRRMSASALRRTNVTDEA